MWHIVGRSRFGKEDIDSAETFPEARRLLDEYRLAFGAGWALWIVRRPHRKD